jgi:hypothetical protein
LKFINFFLVNSFICKKAKKKSKNIIEKLAFYGLDMQLDRNRNRNFSNVGTGTGTIIFSKVGTGTGTKTFQK